jgi:hypothetical protein
MLPSAWSDSVGVLIADFRSSIPSPPIPLFTFRCAPHDAQRKTRGRVDRYSFLVRDSHPLLPAGLSRHTRPFFPKVCARTHLNDSPDAIHFQQRAIFPGGRTYSLTRVSLPARLQGSSGFHIANSRFKIDLCYRLAIRPPQRFQDSVSATLLQILDRFRGRCLRPRLKKQVEMFGHENARRRKRDTNR